MSALPRLDRVGSTLILPQPPPVSDRSIWGRKRIEEGRWPWLLVGALTLSLHAAVASVPVEMSPSEIPPRPALRLLLVPAPPRVTPAAVVLPPPVVPPSLAPLAVKSHSAVKSHPAVKTSPARSRHHHHRHHRRARRLRRPSPPSVLPSPLELPPPPAPPPSPSLASARLTPPRAVGPDTPPAPLDDPAETTSERSSRPDPVLRRMAPVSPAAMGGAALRRWGQSVRGGILSHRRYPRAARRMGLEGTVTVAVALRADGRLASPPKIERSSGHAVLDREALRMVRAAAPFVPPEASSPGAVTRFVVPIEFAMP